MIVVPNSESIGQAVELLHAGQCVAVPTETVYGLAADALNPEALARIFAIKNRPFFDPLILHIAEGYDLLQIVESIPAVARTLMASFWPGPLTLLLPKKPLVPDLATSGLSTVAVRCPAHPVAQRLLREFGSPLAAPSANKFGRISPTTAQAVQEELGAEVALILDGGDCRIGVESTIVDVTGAQVVLMRSGGIAVEQLTEKVGPIAQSSGKQIKAPGMLQSHYAPSTPLRRLPSAWPTDRELPADTALLAWQQYTGNGQERVRILTPEGDETLAAVRLFQYLRELDHLGVKQILSEPVPIKGLGLAIHDRLHRASMRDAH